MHTYAYVLHTYMHTYMHTYTYEHMYLKIYVSVKYSVFILYHILYIPTDTHISRTVIQSSLWLNQATIKALSRHSRRQVARPDFFF
jgi:hypothetical protein